MDMYMPRWARWSDTIMQGRIQQESQIEYRKTEGRIKRVTRSRQRSKMPEHY
ncbi:hypothetical protein LEMLEM_LOCUS15544 [Lemmus lemmus]